MADFTRAGLRPSDWWREAVHPGAEQIEMITEFKRLIDRLEAGESLTEDEWVSLIEGRSPELADYLFEKARCILRFLRIWARRWLVSMRMRLRF